MPDNSDCPFCDYQGPSKVLHNVYDTMADLDVFFIEPLNPVTPGHVLAVPKRHIVSPGTMEGAVVLREAAALASRVYPRSFNLILNFGAEATQTIEHLHVHIVPRYPDDGLALPWTVAA